MIRKLGLALLIASIFFSSCKEEERFRDIPQKERNELDDLAILQYLQDHYFDHTRGVIEKFDDETVEDEDHPSLLTLGVKLNSGVWVVKKPDVDAEGPSVSNNNEDSILISFNSMRFRSDDDDLEEGQSLYERSLSPFFNTIYSSGTPSWDPLFYYKEITDDMIENNLDESNYIIEGFVEGLKHFQSTETNGSDLYNFQGAIIIPSREAYGRDLIYISGQADPATYRDNSFIFNFELHKVVPRSE